MTIKDAYLQAAAPFMRQAIQEVYNNMSRTADNAWALKVLRDAMILADGEAR